MNLLDRLLGHDSWTTRRLIEICFDLNDEQLDQEFDIGHRTIRGTLDHVIWNIECWTDLMGGGHVRCRSADVSMRSLAERFENATKAFHVLAHQIDNDSRLDDSFLDALDDPPRRKSFGSTILHIVTHGMHHRAQLMFMLRRLGVNDIPEGDALSWECAVTSDPPS